MPAYSFKKRFIVPIRLGLGLPYSIDDIDGDLAVSSLPKRQTIRAIGRRRHARPGEAVQLYYGMRTKQCEKIGEGRCTAVLPIRIVVKEHSMPTEVDGKHVGVGSAEYPGGMRELAQLDGFEHAEDMHEFWKQEHGLGEFNGLLIKWESMT